MSSYRTRLVTKTHFSGHWHWRKAKGRCAGRRQAQAYSLSYLYGGGEAIPSLHSKPLKIFEPK